MPHWKSGALWSDLASTVAGAGPQLVARPAVSRKASGLCRRFVVQGLVLVLAVNATSAAQPRDDEESPRLYRTSEEKREAGVEHELTSWLTAQSLLESETTRERRSGDGVSETESESEITIDLGLTATASEHLKGEVELEFESSTNDLFTDEAVAVIELEPWELSLGRQYLPFGVFYSQFATGPLLEFGETRVKGAMLTYDVDDRVEVSASVYEGLSRELETGSRELNGALGVEAWLTGNLSMSLGYMDNLADADGRLLEEEGNRYARRVPGISGHLLWTMDRFELSFEALGALRSFEELDADRDRPWAWSLEFVRFADPRFDWALRVEGSEALEDEPELRFGAAVNFRYHPRAFVTVEYLHGRFANDLATDEDDNSLEHVNQVGILLSIQL